MKTKDLMMGDWIQSPITPKPLKVAQINWDYSVECVGIDDMVRYHVGLGDIKPILITPEILGKNFEKKALWGIYDDYYDFTIREWNGMFIVNYHYCEIPMPDTQIVGISYVHELQNALRMCGIEKEIII